MEQEDNFVIRKMTAADVPEVCEIERTCFSDPWSETSFLDALGFAYTGYLVAEIKGEIVGYCGYYRSLTEAEIVNVAVAKAFRKQRIGTKLLRELFAQGVSEGVEAFLLEVRASNAAAIALYTSLGFQIETTRKNFYSHPTEDAYVMWKRLPRSGSNSH